MGLFSSRSGYENLLSYMKMLPERVYVYRIGLVWTVSSPTKVSRSEDLLEALCDYLDLDFNNERSYY